MKGRRGLRPVKAGLSLWPAKTELVGNSNMTMTRFIRFPISIDRAFWRSVICFPASLRQWCWGFKRPTIPADWGDNAFLHLGGVLSGWSHRHPSPTQSPAVGRPRFRGQRRPLGFSPFAPAPKKTATPASTKSTVFRLTRLNPSPPFGGWTDCLARRESTR